MVAGLSFRTPILFLCLFISFYFVFIHSNWSSGESSHSAAASDDFLNMSFDEYIIEQQKRMDFQKTLEDSMRNSEKRLSDSLLAVIDQNSGDLPNRNNSLTATELCSQPNACVQKFLNLTTHIRIAPAHKMLTCIVQKSLSTVMMGFYCFLFNEARYRASGRAFASEWGKYRFCGALATVNNLNVARDFLNITDENEKEWSMTMITREPIERFISGFVDRCIREPNGRNPCNGCGYNMTCFAETEYQRMLKQTGTEKVRGTFEDVHFFPQNSHCELKRDFDSYTFIKSGQPSFVQELTKTMERQNVSRESIDFARSQLSSKKGAVHTTEKYPVRVFLEQRLRKSPYLLELIVRMFYHDFVLFKYDFPPGF